MGQLTNQFVSQSYQGLLNLENANTGLTINLQTVTDGLGGQSPLQLSQTQVNISGTFTVNGQPIAVDTGSLVTTSSFNAYTSSVDLRFDGIELETGSLQNQINSLASTGSLTSLSSSIAVTDLSQDGRLTSLEGITGSLQNQINQKLDTGSFDTYSGNTLNLINQKLDTGSFNTYSGDTLNLINTKLDSSSFNSYTSSVDTKLAGLDIETGSLQNQINGLATTGSLSGYTTVTTFNNYTSSNDTKVNSLIANTGSYATTSSLTSLSQSIATTDLGQDNRLGSLESKTGSYATTGSNDFVGQQNINGSVNVTGSLNVTGEITALSASITYLETIFQTSSVLFSSGSNILGDEASDTQTLFGTVRLPNGPLVVTGSVTASSGFVGDLTGTSSYATNALSSSHSINSDTSISSSFATNALSASYAPSTPLPSGLVSGSSQISYTGITDVPSGLVSGSSQISDLGFATTGSNVFKGNQILSGSFTQTGSMLIRGNPSGDSTTLLRIGDPGYGVVDISGNGQLTATNTVKLTSIQNWNTGGTSAISINNTLGDIGLQPKSATGSIILGTNQSSRIQITGSLLSPSITGSLEGTASYATQALSASYAPQDPLPAGLVSGSSQISYTGITDVPSGLVSGSSQVSYTGITDVPSGIVSSSAQVSFTGITDVPVGLVSGSSQISDLGFATTGSNTFLGNQTITGSLNVSGRSSLDGPLSSTDGLIKLYSTASLGGTVQPGQFITASAPVSQSNIVFASLGSATGQGSLVAGQSGSIQISGSNNILLSSNRNNFPLGLVGYIGSQNIGPSIPTLNTSSFYRPTLNNNLLYGVIGMSMGSGSGVPSIGTNVQFGNTTLNVPLVTGGTMNYSQNFVVGNINYLQPNSTQGYNIAANNIAGFVTLQGPLSYTGTAINTIQQNIVNGTFNIQNNSGSFQAFSNTINGATISVTSSYKSTALATNAVQMNNNSINGLNHRILFDGVATGAKGFFNNLIGGANFTGSMLENETRGITNFVALGTGLYAESGDQSNFAGSTFLGRWNETGSLANPGRYRFVIGNGTNAANRLTSLALDGTTNTFQYNSNINITGNTQMSGNLGFPLTVDGTINSKRLQFDKNPFNNDPSSNLGAIRFTGDNLTFYSTNYDLAELTTQSMVYQTVITGSNRVETGLRSNNNGSDYNLSLINQSGTGLLTTNTNNFIIQNNNATVLIRSNEFNSGSQLAQFGVIADDQNPGGVYSGFVLWTPTGYTSATSEGSMVINSYTPEYPSVPTFMFVGGGNNPAGSDTAIAFPANGEFDVWKKSNFKYPMSVTGSLGVSGSVTIQSGSGDLFVHGNKQFNGAQYSTLQTLSGSANVSQSVYFDTTGPQFGVSLVDNTKLTVANSGTYNIQFSAQLLADTGADNTYIWFKKNGTNIAGSASELAISNNDEALMTVNILDTAVANDYYEICWESDNGDAVLLHQAASGNRPAVPSVITTVTQVR
jgi:hypothetical protein